MKTRGARARTLLAATWLFCVQAACGGGEEGDPGVEAGVSVRDGTGDVDGEDPGGGSAARCGNGLVEPGETCDTNALGGQSCVALGFARGILSCSATCTFDLSQCIPSDCGNGVAEGAEACDGADLSGRTCTNLGGGFTAGTLACDACAWNTGGCCAADLASSTEHCGACHAACDPTVADRCVEGDCRCGLGLPCDAGRECCDGACRDVLTDLSYCGACDTPCAPEVANSCANGACLCGGDAACTGGRTCCHTSCEDLDTDPDNCGDCRRACPAGQSCVDGQCSCGGAICAVGEGCCGGTCAPLDGATSCGSCDNTCDTNYRCYDGQCGCGGPGEICTAGTMGEPPQCCPNGSCVVHTLTDPSRVVSGVANCGTCGNDCAPWSGCVTGMCIDL